MSKNLKFTKMHGIGNDYIYIEQSADLPRSLPELAIILSRRRFSVGSDGIILIGQSDSADASMRVFNADGSEAEMCGNGLRCLAKYVYDRGMVGSSEMTIETAAGINRARIISSSRGTSQVEVVLPEPETEPARIPLQSDHPFINEPLRQIEPGLSTLFCTTVNLGNPHCVIFIEDDVDDFDVPVWGPEIERNSLFPQKTNVEFANSLSDNHIKARVWERGSGETLACGSGACACVVVGILLGKVNSPCTVSLPGGDLTVFWSPGAGVSLIGPAEEIYSGEIPFSFFENR